VTEDVRVAADDATAEAGESDAIVVRLGAGRFAVDLGSVAEVGKAPHVTRVPGVPSWLAGVANWRGRILPVLDLRGLLGGEQVELTARGRLVVVATDVATVGLVVDAVDGTTTIAEQVAEFPAALPGPGAELIVGQLPRPDGPIAVLDVAAIIRLRDALPRGRRSA